MIHHFLQRSFCDFSEIKTFPVHVVSTYYNKYCKFPEHFEGLYQTLQIFSLLLVVSCLFKLINLWGEAGGEHFKKQKLFSSPNPVITNGSLLYDKSVFYLKGNNRGFLRLHTKICYTCGTGGGPTSKRWDRCLVDVLFLAGRNDCPAANILMNRLFDFEQDGVNGMDRDQQNRWGPHQRKARLLLRTSHCLHCNKKGDMGPCI